MTSTSRRYEIDALRVIALGLLIAYHIFIAYQPFADMLGFIRYEATLERYWFIGDLFNIWRIPVLFVVSGMALGFVLRRRTVKEVLVDRVMRLVPPLVFGSLAIAPLTLVFYTLYHQEPIRYLPTPGHLWFIMNLVTYSVIMLPLVALAKRHPPAEESTSARRGFALGLLVVFPLPLMLESALSQPASFSLFPIRFWYGLICYFFGFVFLQLGDAFWWAIRRACHVSLPLALVFYLARTGFVEWEPISPNHGTTAFESAMWMLAFLGYGSLLLNRPSQVFAYLNKAVFPIYIIHMPVQQGVTFFLFRGQLDPLMVLGLHLLLTFGLCGLIYEFIIRRFHWLHPVMGLRLPAPPSPESEALRSASLWQGFGHRATLYVFAPLVVLAQIAMVVFFMVQGNQADAEKEASDNLWGAARQNNVEALETFIEAGETSLDELDPLFRLSPLHWAALEGSLEAAEALLASGAKVNVRSADQSTPLMHAAFFRNTELVALFLEHEADLNPWNQYLATAMDNAHSEWLTVSTVAGALGVEVGREAWKKGSLEVRELLLAKGAKKRAEL